MKILICGLPGSGKTTLARSLAPKLNAVRVNADKVREKYNDWSFDREARSRQALRMKYLCDGVNMAQRPAIADFVCPTEETRAIFDADFVIWMDTIEEGRYADTNAMFEPLKFYNHRFTLYDDIEEMSNMMRTSYYRYIYLLTSARIDPS